MAVVSRPRPRRRRRVAPTQTRTEPCSVRRDARLPRCERKRGPLLRVRRGASADIFSRVRVALLLPSPSVGNLPYDTNERDLGAFCSSVGPVNNVRLVTDVHTGRGRGIAFVEFRDVVTAGAAIRNLNNAEFRGRALRVDFSDPSHRGKKEQMQEAMASGHMPPQAMGGRPGGFGGGPMMGGPMMAPGGGFNRAEEREKEELRKVFSTPAPSPPAPAVPMMMPMQDVHMSDARGGGAAAAAAASALPSTIGAHAPTVQPVAQPYGTDTIGKLVTSLTKAQLLEILSEYKKFSAANPDGAKQLLFDSPQVASTLLHILIMFGLVRPQDVANIQTMQRPVQGSVPQMTLPGAMPPPQQQQQPQPQPAMPPQPVYQPAPMAYAPPPPPAYAQPLPPPPVAAPAPASVAFTEQDAFMLKEIMKLSPAQIQQLPQEVQDKIRLLQQQLEAQAR